MIRWLIVIWILMSVPGLAAPVAVTSGEHEGFTRLVFDFGHPVDWQVGRSDDGYAIKIKGERPTYDLRQAFALIGKSRLAAIWAEPETGVLRLGIACACHGIPFEFRPGIVVMDLKDGPPPKGSSFELTFAGDGAPNLSQHPLPRPRPRPEPARESSMAGYDWMETLAPPKRDPAPSGRLSSDPMLQPLRESLLRHLSRGAAEGVVDMNSPKADPASEILKDFPSAQVRIGESHSQDAEDPATNVLTAVGADCLPDEKFAFSDWGNEDPVSTQFALAMEGLTGEFDRPEPVSIQRAIQFQLYLGFGAEARQLIRAFDPELADTAIWQSLAHLLDEEPDPTPMFGGQSACDGAVALWALLSDPLPGPGETVNAEAIRRSFSSLPLHLRRHLGPRLAERFLLLGEAESARAIRDAILRAPGEAGAEVAVMEAEMALHAGDPARAEQRMEAVLADPGPDGAEALIALVHARVAQSLPVSPDVVTALQAHLSERAGHPEAVPFAEALTLAQAASGDFASAFATPDQSPEVEQAIWSLLARLGPDDALLAQAILPQEVQIPTLPAEPMKEIGKRLLSLGFADAAQRWFAAMAEPDPLLIASATLQAGDARTVVQSLAGRDDAEALMLKAKALGQIGDSAAEANALRRAGLGDAAQSASSRARDWTEVARNGPDPWKAVAAAAIATAEDAPPAPPDPLAGPLTKGHALTEQSAATRAAVLDLLAAVPLPDTAKP